MALSATVHQFEIRLSHVDRGVYETLELRVARHPSETDERMMMRLLAFAFYADERLEFGKGLSTADEPALGLGVEPCELVVGLEKRFGVKVPNSEAAKQALLDSKMVGLPPDVYFNMKDYAITADGSVDIEVLHKMQDDLLKYKFTRNKVDPASFVDLSFLPK